MPLITPIVLFLSCMTWLTLVMSIPSFEGVTNWAPEIGSLVPGMSYLEALGPNNNYEGGSYVPRYVSLTGPQGTPGNVTVAVERYPPLFYVHNNQLWHYHNATTILPVNVHNSTLSSQLPLQLVVGTKRDGVKGGGFRWQGTQLFYEQGRAGNRGVYYSCQDTNGLMGLFLFMTPSPTPAGCTLFTVHSFMRDYHPMR